jgi:hypothetical protein
MDLNVPGITVSLSVSEQLPAIYYIVSWNRFCKEFSKEIVGA